MTLVKYKRYLDLFIETYFVKRQGGCATELTTRGPKGNLFQLTRNMYD